LLPLMIIGPVHSSVSRRVDLFDRSGSKAEHRRSSV
jgi:hypothetical protein